ncbi:MAG: peroxiredoxin [Anaerolineales bacterium]
MGITIGDRAPDFELQDQHGDWVRLSDFLHQPIVVFFYPKAHSPGCTMEACAFRDDYEAFIESGAVVLGISSDSVTDQRSFGQKHNLQYPLLSDQGGHVRQAWGVGKTLGILPGRVTYIIDPDGIVRGMFNSQINVTAHVREALDILAKIRQEFGT